MDCVIASADGTESGRLAIADVVADHRREPAGMASRRAAQAFERLPGCSVFLAADASGGYRMSLRDGRCAQVRGAPGCGHVPAAVAEACALLVYAWACAGQVPSAVTVTFALAHPLPGPAR